MTKSDILQDISVELSKSIKKHLQHIKQLPSADKKQIEKLISNFKDGLDDLSEGANESVNEGKNDFMARGLNTNIMIKNQPNKDLSEKLYYALIDLMKKEKFSPNEITIKF